MTENQRFQIIIGSPVDYEELVAYIRIDDAQLALLSQDKGKEHLEVVFFQEIELHRVDYDVLLAALEAAKRLLLK
ncbi:MAG TPA: hypothetical protein PK760_14505 [Flavobacteriales bacterium]|nr:hypothetical protein [Flavobacteriales bacterium]